VAQNVLAYGTGAFNLKACQVPTSENLSGGAHSKNASERWDGDKSWRLKNGGAEYEQPDGRWPPNLVLGDEAAAEMDRQSGVSMSRTGKPRQSAKPGDGYGMTHTGSEYADSGGASRFFPVFKYTAKAPTCERPRLPDGTAWPTVKPLDFVRWLCRLVCPPGGVVLDPFCGSGTTAEACIVEGFRCITIDRDPVALQLAMERLRKPIQPVLFGEEAS
jgi:site-specific DNA-methyltransferase (adenine-specific)